MSITSKSRKGKMSSLDPSSNQLQLLDEGEEKDPDHDLEAEEDHKDKGLHSSRSFQPSPQQLLGRLHEKPEVDSYQEKWPTLVASCTPLTTKQQCIGYTRHRDRAQGFGQEAPKMRLKRTKGENEEEEGHINCSTGSKDKHSKVCTSKGLRDRRVRLSANTAIDFYDVQDRLGFDRPSKAIDWLMKKAKVAIDALGNQSKIAQLAYQEFEGHIPSQIHYQTQQESKFPNPEYDIQNQQNLNDNPSNNFSFISMICGSSSSTSIDFHNNQHDLNPRTRSQTQDLCLSIQSLQEDQTLLQEHSSPHSFGEHQHSLFSGSTPVNTTSNMDWFQKMIAQNSNSEGFATYSSERNLEQILYQTQLFYQREPLQSTFLPSICASLMNTQLPNIDYHLMPAFNSASVTSTGLAYNEFSDYPQIQGQEVVAVDPTSNRSSSASSFLHYED